MEESEMQIKTDKPWLWKKGQSGNPAGRPHKKTFRDYFTDAEEAEVMERVKEKLSEKEIMKMVVEQLFGKPRQNIGLDGGEDGKPVGVVILPQKNVHSLGTDKETTGGISQE